ncbi:MAG TPA: cation:proton antiporter, partial [Polyangiaceae bacterium]
MQTIILLLVATQVVISAAASFAPKLKIPAPLILVLAGIGVSLIPKMPDVVIDPEIIMLGILPPLLYASATSVPVMNFRRDFRAISALSVVLVVFTSLALGSLFHHLIPGISLGWGVALGAILSPTDAVATSIIEGRGVPGRVSVLLDCEGLLNDASALIVLRTAIVATALGFSFWPTVGSFFLSIAIAFVFGKLAATLNLAIRKRVREEAVNTILSFTTPFAAALPAEHFHGSGLVAAVIAGFFTGMKAPRELPPGHRVSDAQNWATVELGLEGAIFLTMGLQLATIVRQIDQETIGLARGFEIAVLALLVTLAVRAVYVGPLLRGSNRRAKKKISHQAELATMQEQLRAGQIPDQIAKRAQKFHMPTNERALKRFETRIQRYLADLDYLASQPFGRRETTIVVWAGMRGAVTVAAVQLLPPETPHRPLLVFIA